MGLKNTILGWIRTDPDKSDELEDAEIDAADKEYAEQKAGEHHAGALRLDARRVRVGPGATAALSVVGPARDSAAPRR